MGCCTYTHTHQLISPSIIRPEFDVHQHITPHAHWHTHTHTLDECTQTNTHRSNLPAPALQAAHHARHSTSAHTFIAFRFALRARSGGNGFLGQHLIKLLRERDADTVKEIRCVDLVPFERRLGKFRRCAQIAGLHWPRKTNQTVRRDTAIRLPTKLHRHRTNTPI